MLVIRVAVNGYLFRSIRNLIDNQCKLKRYSGAFTLIQPHATVSLPQTLTEFNYDRTIKSLARRGLTESNVVTSTEDQPCHHAKSVKFLHIGSMLSQYGSYEL